MAKILVIDDEKGIRYTLKEILEYEKYEVDEAANGKEGWEKLQQTKYDVVLCDIKMPELDGKELLKMAMNEGIESPFIMISAHGNIDTAVEAVKIGAYDFLQKPPDLNRLLITIRNALASEKLVQETKTLRKKIASKTSMVGQSSSMKAVQEMIEKVAPTDARVLILGPNGAGKELVARALHTKSLRSTAPFIEVNCAAIPSELIESELFGHEKGSFTSAIKQKIGKFEQAHQGTLFLDEIGDMSLSAQAKVLRALQENKIARVGGEKDITVQVRVIAATNKDLKKCIEEKTFREDLYHRLSVIIIQVPSLADRKEDIPLLVERFLEQIAEEYGNAPKTMLPDAIQLLQKGKWTGNIRELRNVVERLIIVGQNPITKDDVKLYTDIKD